MNKYLDTILNNPVKTIIVIVIVSITLGLGIFKLEFDSSLEAMMPKRDREYILNKQIKKTYGNNGEFIIVCISTDNALKYDFLKKIDDLHNDIEEYKIFNEELENSRLGKFSEFTARDGISFSEMLNAFNNDPVFKRYLQRKTEELFGEIKILSKGDLNNLKDEIIESMNIKKEEIIDLIVSPLTAKDIIGEDDVLITYDLIEKDKYNKRIIPRTEEKLKEFQTRLFNNPAFEKGIYVKDKKTGIITDFGIMLRLVEGKNHDLISREIKNISNGYNLKIILQGVPIVYREINQYMQNDLKTFFPLVILVIVIIFFLNFRSVRGVLLPFLTLSLADIWILGLMGHLGYKLSVMGIALPPLMMAVGSSYSIHILNQYYIDLESISSTEKIKGLKSSMSHISLTVMLAGVTTFIGFIMLLTNQVPAIRVWGIFSGIGIIFAVIIAISLIPAMFALLPHKMDGKNIIIKKSNPTIKGVSRIINYFSNLVINHYKAVLIATAFILILAIIGAFQIQIETSIHAYFKKGDPILTSSRIIGKKFGGAFGLNILIDSGKKEGVKNPEFLKTIEKIRAWLESDENSDLNIGRTDAFPDYIKTMNLAMNNNDISYYKIPEKRVDIDSYIDIYSGEDDNDDGRIDSFEPYVDKHFQTVNIFSRLCEKDSMLSSVKLKYSINKIHRYLDKNLPEEYSYKTSGEPKIMIKLSEYVVNGQIMSLIFSLIVVCLIVILLFRNLFAGLLGLIPISVAVLINFGVMGWAGIRLDIATAIIASITIGIGIDDTIHFLNSFRHFRAKGYSIDNTISMTLSITGKAIIYTSLALIFGFLVLAVSNFKLVVFFSILAAVTMIATTMGALLVLPATIKFSGLSLSISDSRIWKHLDIGKIFKFNNK